MLDVRSSTSSRGVATTATLGPTPKVYANLKRRQIAKEHDDRAW
jgi:hypothetical protein